ncbi:MAG TPA: CPBP family glutamic-type intramembrane protease, partial [Acidimicrobiales bacterium]|nr:CPBP family glutamic-type intramembrane protease [Acidimicrobiales bacterium]
IVPAVVFGSGLCLLYHWTGSLYPPLALHALSNSLLAATALGSTWQFPVAVILAVVATLAVARLVAVLLGDGRSRPD